jgi:hypothetical protein
MIYNIEVLKYFIYQIKMEKITDEKILARTKLYSGFFLTKYDWVALSYNCRFIWKRPSQNMLKN